MGEYLLNYEQPLFSNIFPATCICNPKKWLIAKVVNISSTSNYWQFENESTILSLLSSNRIIKMHKRIEQGEFGILILERLDCDLFTILPELSSNKEFALDIFTKICDAVKYCHSKNVAHLDLKPENILIQRKSDSSVDINLADFGSSVIITKNTQTSGIHGTKQYTAPEAFYNRTYDPKKADIWSLGILLHVLLTGCWPFSNQNDHDLPSVICNGRIHIVCAEELKTLLQRILNRIPEERPDVTEILKSLKRTSEEQSIRKRGAIQTNTNRKRPRLALFAKLKSQ